MAQAVLGAFAEATRKENEGLDLPFLRRGLHRFYQCDRSFPLTLDGFKAAIFDYSDVPYYDLEVSFPKLFERRMREAHLEGVYVAETLVEGVARETEILLSKARSDGALEFLVYDEAGRLVDRGAFATAAGGEISGASPYTCIACHFEKGTFEFIVTFPSL